MGCDIHAYIEEPIHYGNRWALFARLEIDRFYDLFGLMAGVRGDVGMFSPKGMPGAVSSEVAEEWDGGSDWHTPSWLTTAEFSEVCRALVAPPRVFNQAIAIREMLYALPGSRIVFWFDN